MWNPTGIAAHCILTEHPYCKHGALGKSLLCKAGASLKLKKYHLKLRKRFCMVRLARCWHRLNKEVVGTLLGWVQHLTGMAVSTESGWAVSRRTFPSQPFQDSVLPEYIQNLFIIYFKIKICLTEDVQSSFSSVLAIKPSYAWFSLWGICFLSGHYSPSAF